MLFATHPTLPFANGSLPVSPPGILAALNLDPPLRYLVPRNRPSSGPIVLGLCGIVGMDFRKHPFQALA
jgi:hypothetical protein